MKKWEIFCLVLSVLSAIAIVLIFSNYNKEIKASESVIVKRESNSLQKDTEEYTAVFEVASIDNGVSEDIEVYPTGYNGEYIEDDGTKYINLARPKTSVTLDDKKVILLNDDSAWSYLTDGMITSYPDVPYKEIKDIIKDVYDNHSTQIVVDVWYWANPDDNTDMSKVTRTIKLTVHDKLANIFTRIFADIYKDESKPVININDAGMGTWVLRGKNHSDYNTLSAHALGTAIDINPSTGSYSINGVTYGNGYGNRKMPYDVWKELPETHTKYHVLYEDCAIVNVFKAYGFYWGGDWENGTDSMHLAFLGDSSGREAGYSNYLKYGR